MNDINIWYKYFLRAGPKLKPLDVNNVLESTEVYSYYQSVKELRNLSNHLLKNSYSESQKVLQLIKDELRKSE